MRKVTALVMLALMAVLAPAFVLAAEEAVWIPLIPEGGPEQPALRIVSAKADEVLLEIELPGFFISRAETEHGPFTELRIPGFGRTTDIGKALLPVLRRAVEIPQGGAPRLEVVELEVASFDLAKLGFEARVYPVQPPIEKLPGARESAEFAISEGFYASGEPYPSYEARIESVGQMRGHRFAMLEVAPTRYSPSKGSIDVLSRIKVKIFTPEADIPLTRTTVDRYASPSFEISASRVLMNYQPPTVTAVPGLPIGYLIITDPDFYDEIQPLAAWKHTKGFHTSVTSTADIPGGATTTAIKAYIKNAWQTWEIPPSFVLLVGDVEDIPNWTGTEEDNPPTDLYYATMTDPDYIPDLGIGRFSVTASQEATALVGKTVDYEKQLFTGTGWLKKAVFMASEDNYAITEGTHNYVVSTYMDPAGYASDKLYVHTYGATTQQVRDAFNNGRGLGIYSGHGAVTYWADGPYFTQTDVNGLTNLDMYPFVQSYACYTGRYMESECFAETWVRATDKTGLAFWASSVTSYWDEDDVLEKGVFKALFDDDLTWISGMTNQGKWYVYEHYSGNGSTKRYYEMYNLMGDPSLEIWTDEPSPMTADHTGACPLGAATYPVHVEDAAGPIADALVCLNMPGYVYETAYTGFNGDVVIGLDPAPTQVGDMFLTVSHHNHTPVMDTVLVVVPAFVTIDPDTTEVETQTTVTVTVVDTLYAPVPGVVVTIDGWGIEPALVDTTDTLGVAVITVDAPYGEVLSAVGREIGQVYDCFNESVVVTGALTLPGPQIEARADEIALVGALTPDYQGTIIGRTAHTGLDMFALGCGVSESVTSPADTALLEVTPTGLGQITVVLAYPGYEIYSEGVSVIEAYGTLAGAVTDAVSGDSLSGAVVSAYTAGTDTSASPPVFEVMTGGDGAYASPESILVGDYDIYVMKFGYLGFAGSTLVGYGGNTFDIAIIPAPSGILSGTVSDQTTGKPLTADLAIYRSDDLSLYAEATSDSMAGGAYTTDPLPYFTYLVRVKAPHYVTLNTYVTVDEGLETRNFELDPTLGNLLVVNDLTASVPFDTKIGPKGEVISFGEAGVSNPGSSKSADIIEQDLTDLGYDVTSETAQSTDPLTWPHYDIVIWSSGDETSPVSEASCRLAMNQYVGQGGRLLIEGGEIGYDAVGYPGYPNFADTTLHTLDWTSDSAGGLKLLLPLHPVATTPNILPATLAVSSSNYGDEDALVPDPANQIVFEWSSYPGSGGVLVYDDNPDPASSQIVFLAFDYANVTDTAARRDLLQNCVEHLMRPESTPDGSVCGRVELAGETTYEGVQVRALPGGFKDTTDASGNYLIEGVYDGIYTVTASKAGFGDSSVVVEITGGSALEGVDFELYPLFEYMQNPDIPIPDNDPTGIRAYIDVDAAAAIASVDCYVDIQHTYRGDLIVELKSPEGTTVRLHNRTGSSADDITTWYDAETVPDGPGSMADFVGEWAAGTWELWVSDQAARDTGTLEAWGLRLAFPSATAGGETAGKEIPEEHFLVGARPNPFATSTRLRFGLAREERIRLAVYNVLGREIAVLADGFFTAGVHNIAWDGTDTGHRPVASGIYFIRLKAGDFIRTHRVIRIR